MNPTLESIPTDVEAAADLGPRAAQAAPPQPYDLGRESSVVVRTVRSDERVETVDLEHLLDVPRRPRGLALLYDPDDFAAYVDRLEGASTTVWADEDGLTVTALFNDHNAEEPGWRDHFARLQVRRDPDWQAWVTRDNVLGTQVEFAEHLEEQAHAIVEPDAATMLEVATSFQARRDSSFSRAARLDSGDVQLAWNEETTASAGASGRLEVPRRFVLRLAPFVGVAPVEIVALLRYRLRDGRLSIGYKLHRPDTAERNAFADIRASIANAISSPVLSGRVPNGVR